MTEVETLDHMIWNCKEVKKFWQKFDNFIQRIFGIPVTKQDIYYGCKDHLLCMITIMAKQFIYKSNRNGKQPCFNEFENNVKYVKRIEEKMFYKNNQIEKWYDKWEKLL